MRRLFIIAIAATIVSLGLFAQQRNRLESTRRVTEHRVSIHIYPEELNSRDQLTDGDTERLFRLDDNTLLIWVDLEPGLFFSHSTAYVLISSEGVRVERGNWWPVLNGHRILYGQQNRTPVISPFSIWSEAEPVNVHFYSEVLDPSNNLSDGTDDPIPLESRTFLAWVDLHPGLFFTHQTAYLLIGADKSITVIDGGWWPELNGKTVLYNNQNKHGITSPFELRGGPGR
ncbi:MAG: hypothetical protein JSU96_20505 [Acidobacteriota bacterium]|nr:MAG: hypothetical protein JSU96_20505 [Acidobacteriota bacterium]